MTDKLRKLFLDLLDEYAELVDDEYGCGHEVSKGRVVLSPWPEVGESCHARKLVAEWTARLDAVLGEQA